MSLTFDLKGYLRGFLLLAVATAVFSLVNLALSAVPDTLVVGGGDLAQLCGVNATSVATPAPAPTPAPTPITNINFYDPFNALDTVYWRNLTHPWVVVSGHVRTSVSDSSYNNAIYYAVDFIEPYHDTVKLSTRVRIDAVPGYNEVRSYCVFLASSDLSVRILGCIETFNSANAYYYVYARIREFRAGSVALLRSLTIEGSSHSDVMSGTRDLSLTLVKLNETHARIELAGTRRDGTSFSLPPVTTSVNWNSLGYFGFYMSHAYRSGGFDYIDAWITSVNATSTVYYSVNFPPPLPAVTTTVTVTEAKILELGRDVLVIPLGSFIRVLSFMVYVVYIVRTVKHFVPEF